MSRERLRTWGKYPRIREGGGGYIEGEAWGTETRKLEGWTLMVNGGEMW